MTERKRRPYTRMELNSPGIRAPLDWRRVMDTVEALDDAETRASEAEGMARRLTLALVGLVDWLRHRHPPQMGGGEYPPSLRPLMEAAGRALGDIR